MSCCIIFLYFSFKCEVMIYFGSCAAHFSLVPVNNATHTDVPYVFGTDNYLKEINNWIDFSIQNRKLKNDK